MVDVGGAQIQVADGVLSPPGQLEGSVLTFAPMLDGDARYSVQRLLIDDFDAAELAPCTSPCLVWRPSGSYLNSTLSRIKNFATQTHPKAKKFVPMSTRVVSL